MDLPKSDFACPVCGKIYKVYRSLWRHLKYECQKEPAFSCPLCRYRAKHKASITKHISTVHQETFGLHHLLNTEERVEMKKYLE
nr:unnamed protein product [Callosobruchus chinensis]